MVICRAPVAVNPKMCLWRQTKHMHPQLARNGRARTRRIQSTVLTVARHSPISKAITT